MKIKPLERSPAEKAFDFLFFPSFLNVGLFVFAFFLIIADSDNQLARTPPALLWTIQIAGVASLIHWLIGARKVMQSWHDPAGKVLRLASLAMLAMQALAIATAFSMRPVAWLISVLSQ